MLKSQSRLAWTLVFASWLLPNLVLTGPLLATNQTLGFRDATHYYLPLLQLVRTAWRESLPLWNPWEERGRPLLADPTSGVLYPGQLLAGLPISTVHFQELLVALHLTIGWVAMFHAARRLRTGLPAACLAATSYTWGGAVLFQACNLPYLIGASWLPLGLIGVLEAREGRGWASRLKLGAALILMILAGDPETAYLLGVASLVAVVLAVVPGCRSRPGSASVAAARLLVRFASIGLLAAGCTAIQWLPSLVWAQNSPRISLPVARSQSTAPGTTPALALDPSQERFAGRTPLRSTPVSQSSHGHARYQFSVGPWRWLELLWPNFGGWPYPVHARWMAAIPAEGRYWTPTLYMGLLPFLYGLAGWRLRGGTLAVQWLSWLVVLGMIGSLGGFGLGWLIRELQPSVDVGEPATGGLYWCLTKLLPGFGWFRYPAKLWIWAAAGFSLLAARRLDDELHGRVFKGPGPGVWICGIAAGVGVVFWPLVQPLTTRWLSQCPADPLFGPLDVSRSQQEIGRSFAHALCLSAAALGLMYRERWWQFRGWAVTLLTVLELALAHSSLLPRVPESVFSVPLGAGLRPSDLSATRYRVYRERLVNWYPPTWAQTRSPHRLEECVHWDRTTLRPKYPSEIGWDSLQSSTSFSSREQLALLQVLRQAAVTAPEDYRSLLEVLGVHFLVTPDGIRPSVAGAPGAFSGASVVEGAPIIRRLSPRPRTWVVHQMIYWPESDEIDDRTLIRRTHEILLTAGRPQKLAEQVVLEGPAEPAIEAMAWQPDSRVGSPSQSPSSRPPASHSRILTDTNCRVTVEATLSQPGWLILNDSFSPDWQATLAAPQGNRRLKVWRANRVMRAVQLPAGKHHVVFSYQPRSVLWGAWISGTTICVTAVACARSLQRLRRIPRSDNSSPDPARPVDRHASADSAFPTPRS